MLAQCFSLFRFFELFPEGFVVQSSIQASAKLKQRNATYIILYSGLWGNKQHCLWFELPPHSTALPEADKTSMSKQQCLAHMCTQTHTPAHKHWITDSWWACWILTWEEIPVWGLKWCRRQIWAVNEALKYAGCNFMDIDLNRGGKNPIHAASQWGSISEKPSHSSHSNTLMDCITVSWDSA